MRVITLDTVGSTNSYVASRAGSLGHGDIVMAVEQTAGRGQRGNSWEAEPGLNLTLSMLLRPSGVEAACQFDISRAVALGTARMLQSLLPEKKVLIKWPNDIYVDDRKIAGILIENTLTGRLIERSIAGIGININQTRFLSDAPNPVSVAQLTGLTYTLPPLAERLGQEILAALGLPAEKLCVEYDSLLWRRDGYHPYRDNLLHTDIEARITAIGPMGHLTLTTVSGESRTYAFKEVTALL